MKFTTQILLITMAIFVSTSVLEAQKGKKGTKYFCQSR